MNTVLVASLLASAEALSFGPFGIPEKPYQQVAVDAKNVLKYTGWQGPYSDRRGYGISRDPPAGARVDQVVQLSRHGERWPDSYDYKEQYATLQKVLKNKGNLNGSIAFANYWEPFAEVQSGWLSEESLVGPYSGLFHAYKLGVDTRRRYYDLYDGQSILPIFASGYERIVDTARKFGEGFLQWNYTTLGALNIIQETADQGANSLVPTCHADIKEKTTCTVPKNSTEANAPWLYPQYDAAVARLNRENPGLHLNRSDIPHLLATAAFELNVRGSSPWVDVFTAEEWNAFEYAQTSLYYCFYGPGSATGRSQGSLFLNATRVLLLQGPEEALPLYFSFAHDTDIIHLLAALGIDEEKEWKAEEVQFGQRYDVTDLTPQGAHIVFERLVVEEDPSLDLATASTWANEYPDAFNVTQNITAISSGNLTYNGTDGKPIKVNATNSSSSSNSSSNSSSSASGSKNENIYVRIVLNEAVVPLKGCTEGPGYSCPLSKFNKWVDERLATIPPYNEFCRTPKTAPQYLDFFWNYNTTTKFDVATEVGYQEGLVSWDSQPITEAS